MSSVYTNLAKKRAEQSKEPPPHSAVPPLPENPVAQGSQNTAAAPQVAKLPPAKPHQRAAGEPAATPAQGFDLTVAPYKPATFVFTAEELRGIEDIKTGLDRTFDLKATKIDIVRCAVHSITHDYQTRGEDSLIVKRIREKNSH
jgi:hypothetical protein